MKKKVIVYAVNSGQYSDYHYNGVFSTREKAEAYMGAFPKDGCDSYNDLEEIELDMHISEIQRGLTHWHIRMYKDGEVFETSKSEYPGTSEVGWLTGGWWKPTKPWANFYAWAKTEQAAIKIANERRIQSIATEITTTAADCG